MPRLATGKKAPNLPSGKKSVAKAATNGKAPAKKVVKKSSKEVDNEPAPLYDKVSAKLCEGDTSITVEQAKEILGWEEETQDVKFGTDYLFSLDGGVKVRCKFNITNRPLRMSNVNALKQEFLRGRWRLNGEPIIVGRFGSILNGQHTLIAFILSVREYGEAPDKYPLIQEEPRLDKVIVFGIDESDDTVNTLDTGKPRTLSDVIFRSEYFADCSRSDRQKLSSITSNAVNVLWDRTGEGLAANAPVSKTQSEKIDFIDRHPTLLKAVKHVYEENEDGRLTKYLPSAGSASAILYLMGCSSSEPSDYINQDIRDESTLNWDRWDDACDFLVLLANKDRDVKALIELLTDIGNDEEEGVISSKERTGLVVKAWNRYIDGNKITKESIALEYFVDEDGFKIMNEKPTVGGIDIDDPEDIVVEPDPTPEEIEAEKERIKIAGRKKGSKTAKGSKLEPVEGETYWVVDDAGGENWKGEVLEVTEGTVAEGKKAKMKVLQGYIGAGMNYTIPVSNLRTEQP